MRQEPPRSEIRDSVIAALLEKARRRSYEKFLASVELKKIRLFAGATISFEFPVVAFIGPNGGGKTTVLAICACIYSPSIRQKAFQRSRIGDETAPDWKIQYELIDRSINPRDSLRGTLTFDGDHWGDFCEGGSWGKNKPVRSVFFLSVMRTLPLTEAPTFQLKSRLIQRKKHKKTEVKTVEFDEEVSNVIRREGERVLGKSLADYKFYTVTATTININMAAKIRTVPVTLPDGRKKWKAIRQKTEHNLTDILFVGKNEIGSFSEFNFGAGESSVLRIIANIESITDGSLVLIDEIENGLHPVAVRRLVEYLIEVAQRKSIQVLFTTHSDDALDPLPGAAIWACLDGRVQQGKLSVQALRAVSGRVDKRLAIFAEDEFAVQWLAGILRERASDSVDEIGLYPIGGDGNAVKTHRAHLANPAISFRSLCYLDGDSRQKEDPSTGIFRLPGGMPEKTIVQNVIANLSRNIALLTMACQVSLGRQSDVQAAIVSVSKTNRDPHLLFAQIGTKLGHLPEAIVRGAFLSVWVQDNQAVVDEIMRPISAALSDGT
jgi:ABC-type branched-subunit amino acid transport system ATPase component